MSILEESNLGKLLQYDLPKKALTSYCKFEGLLRRSLADKDFDSISQVPGFESHLHDLPLQKKKKIIKFEGQSNIDTVGMGLI